MIPFRDHNTSSRFPYVTVGLIAINAIVWLVQLGAQATGNLELMYAYFALIPGRVLSGDVLAVPTFFTSMFMHGGWGHILGNMAYLWIFGDNVENRLGWFGYLAFYIATGLAAGFAHLITNPASMIPTIGASGAISGVLGAYLITYPRAKVDALVFIGGFGRVTTLPAIAVLGFWFVLQLFEGVLSLGMSGAGVAYWAHIGGFVAGLAVMAGWNLITAGRVSGFERG